MQTSETFSPTTTFASGKTSERRSIPGYQNYCVDAAGVIWSQYRGPWAPVRPEVNKKTGYKIVRLSKGGVKTRFNLHELVARAFLGPKPAGQCVRHRDGDKLNVRAENLGYGTYADNAEDARRHGTLAVGTRLPQAQLTEATVLEARKLHQAGATYEQLAAKYSTSLYAMACALRGDTWKHVGGPLHPRKTP